MTMPDLAIQDAVHACHLAEGLDAGQLGVLAGLMSLQACQAQQVLAAEGEVDDRLYVIVSGSLTLVKHLGTPDESVLATLSAGDFAHELGFLDGTPRYASLVAASAAQVLLLERSALERLIDSQPRLLYAVLRAILRSVHRVQTRLTLQATELTNYVVKQHGRY